MIDVNDNVSCFRFTPLAFLQASYVLGKNGDSGDSYGTDINDPNDKPSLFYEYNFLNFYENYISNAAQLNTRFPVFVKTIARETHANGSNSNELTICTVEYSDGFGRLVQTRTQAEETVFGETLDNGLRIVTSNSGLSLNQESVNSNAIGNINTDTNNLNVIVSGWQVYDNKGQIIEKYEPFYAKGFEFETAIDNRLNYKNGVQGEKARMFYDPRGQLIRTINPNNSQQWTLFGKPYKDDVTTPNSLHPSPWVNYIYDANDLANEAFDSSNPSLNSEEYNNTQTTHHYTPSSSHIDSLGRIVKKIDRNDNGEEIIMSYDYDIQSDPIKTIDAFGRTILEYSYDLSKQPIKITHLDGGTKTTVFNAANQPVEIRDDKGAITLIEYDKLNRRTKVWARDNANEDITVRQIFIYGEDSSDIPNPKEKNLIGKVAFHYDESGLSIFEECDFKGNVVKKKKQMVSDDTILNHLLTQENTPINNPVIDWIDTSNNQIKTSYLDNKEFQFDTKYDALNRIISITLPEDLDFDQVNTNIYGRKTIIPQYSRSGALQSVGYKDDILGSPLYNFIDRIAYNARGQRILMACGNGVMTRYAYDAKNFWLKRLRTEKYTKSGGNQGDTTVSYSAIPDLGIGNSNRPLHQDFAYEYDFVGNIKKISDYSPESGYNGNVTPSVNGSELLERSFSYDAIYRLISATGRETNNLNSSPDPWNDNHRTTNLSDARGYTRNYSYDKMGNIESMQHIANGGNFTKGFDYGMKNKNFLENTNYGQTSSTYSYDVNGNITQEGSSRFFEWDAIDKLRAFYIDAGGGYSQYARYLYDSSGNRAKKLVKKQNGDYCSTSYLDGVFEYIKQVSNNGATVKEQTLIHLMDGSSRLVLIRQGDNLDDTTPAIKYCHEDHLGNGSLYTDDTGSLVNREEYYPFGGTSFGSYEKKRYRFNGKERDEESGLYNYGMRYYAPWMCRFVSVDPMAADYQQYSPYQYAGNKPINKQDIDGLEEEGAEKSPPAEGGSANIEAKTIKGEGKSEEDKTLEKGKKFAKDQIKSNAASGVEKAAPKIKKSRQELKTSQGYMKGSNGKTYHNEKMKTVTDTRVGVNSGKVEKFQKQVPQNKGNQHFTTKDISWTDNVTKTADIAEKGAKGVSRFLEALGVADNMKSYADGKVVDISSVLGAAPVPGAIFFAAAQLLVDEQLAEISDVMQKADLKHLTITMAEGYQATKDHIESSTRANKNYPYRMVGVTEAQLLSVSKGLTTDFQKLKNHEFNNEDTGGSPIGLIVKINPTDNSIVGIVGGFVK